MKTKWVVVLTALATCMMFTLFAYCTKDVADPAGGLTATDPTVVLTGTSWKTRVPMGEDELVIFANFTSTSAGNYRFVAGETNLNENFTYKLNGGHGAITSNMLTNGTTFGTFIPNNAVIDIIDSTTIGIGGRVFTKQ